MADITNYDKAEIRTLAEIDKRQYFDGNCCTIFAYAVKPQSRFNVDSDGWFVQIFSSEEA